MTTFGGRSRNNNSRVLGTVNGSGGGEVVVPVGVVGGGLSANGVSASVSGGKCFIRQSSCRVMPPTTSLIRLRATLMCTVILVLAIFSYRTVQRNFDWHDEESLYKSAIHVNPPKGKNG